MTSPPRGRYRELRVKQLRVIKERQSHRARLQGEGLARQGGAVQPVSDERRAELRELAANLVRAPSFAAVETSLWSLRPRLSASDWASYRIKF